MKRKIINKKIPPSALIKPKRAIFKLIYDFYAHNKHYIVSGVSIFMILSFMFYLPRIILINLKITDNNASLYYNVGAVVLKKPNVIDQYLTREKEYTTDYLTSLYETAYKINDKIYTIYRPKSQPIKYENKTYYLYIAESNAYLVENKKDLSVYNNNLIVGPSIGLFGYGNSIYHYKWNELMNAYFNNKIDVDIDCFQFPESNCGGKFEKLNLKIDGVNKEKTSKFDFQYSFVFDQSYNSEKKVINPLSALIIPKDYFVCPTLEYKFYDCLDPVEPQKTEWQDVPVRVIPEDIKKQTTIKLGDLNLSPFYITNLKIADKYTLKTSNPVDLKISNEYYLVHKSNTIAIKITMPDYSNFGADVQKQFNTIRFYGKDCVDTNCKINIRLEIVEK